MSFPGVWWAALCPLLGATAAGLILSARGDGRRAAAWCAGLAAVLGWAGAKAGYLCFFAPQQFARYGAAALTLPRADTFSVAAGAAGAAAGVALGARVAGKPAGRMLTLFSPFGATAIACVRGCEAFLGTLGAGPALAEGHWAAGTFLAVSNAWGEWHWAIYVPEAALAAACAAWGLIRRHPHRGAAIAVTLCCGQMLFEPLRVRAVTWHFIPIDQLWCAGFLLAAGVAGAVRGAGSARGKKIAPLGAMAGWMALNAAAQFAQDQPRLLTDWWPGAAQYLRPICVGGLLLSALGMALAARQSLKGMYSPVRNMRASVS